jgi:ribosomal protein S18 acetylase RimI-like enzyme
MITLAQPNDYPAIVDLINDGYRGSRSGWTTEADYFAGVRTEPQRLARELEEGHMLLLKEGDTLLGCVFLRPRGTDCYLGMLTVSPSTQARGYGRHLMLAAEEKARELGARTITLRVLSPREELMAWYERRGYARTGEKEPFPYAQAIDERPTRMDMEFVIFRKTLGAGS